MPASIVDVLEKTKVGLDKVILTSGVEISQLCFDTFAFVFPAAEEVDARLLRLSGELF